MARENKTRSAAPEPSGKPSPWQRTRLSSFPLSVLLPQLSDVGSLAQHKGVLEDLFEDVRERAETADVAEASNLQIEQNMIQQILQWLDVDSEEN